MKDSKKVTGKYYYSNVLASQNIPAKPNIVWVMDIKWTPDHGLFYRNQAKGNQNKKILGF